MPDDEKVRARLHEAIQSTPQIDGDLPEGAMLMGWVAIAEWMAGDGRRWLSIIDGDARGEGCPEWMRQGYLHNALFDPQGFIEEEQ